MTAIVGLIGKDKTIYIGGDSAGVAGLSLTVRKDPKVFINGSFIMGFTSSFRMGQLLHYTFEPPKHPGNMGVLKYMNTAFIDEVRKCLKDGGYAHISSNEESGGTFLVGYRGQLFRIGSDYQVGIPYGKFDSCGCGKDLCLGSMYSTEKMGIDPKKRITIALKAAEQFSGGVRAPFLIKELPYAKESKSNGNKK
jgi:hypothetical protein